MATPSKMMIPAILRKARMSNTPIVPDNSRIETATVENDNSVPAIQAATRKTLPDCLRAGACGAAAGEAGGGDPGTAAIERFVNFAVQ